MKKVSNFKEFKKCITTDAFWSEYWCIDTLERLLNIKTIVFSKDAYEQDKPFLQCFKRYSTSLQPFRPDHYILLSYQKPVYKLISYNGTSMLTELPDKIRTLIRKENPRDCLFRFIPEFNT